MHDKVAFLCETIRKQFYARTVVEGGKRGVDFGINLVVEEKEKEIWLTFSNGEESHTVTFPIPFMRNGVVLICNNGVERALCNYFDVSENRTLDYLYIIHSIVCGDPTGMIPDFLVKKGPYIQQIVYSFRSGNASTVTYNLQRAINEVVNRMPVHETDMNSWVMNRRLILRDLAFDLIDDPQERLEYQVEKNRKYFDRGWTSIGLSDGTLADKNYILTCDLRTLTPFGLKHHNPQRNLYSTLGMKGDELPKVRSKSMQDRIDEGMTRKGWNLFTAFADIPDVFEDQIMVDKSHASKFINYKRRYSCYGKLLVSKGQSLKYKQALCETAAGERILMDTVADRVHVHSITEGENNVGGAPVKVYNVVVEYRRYLKDGTKITNTHGNKGVIRLKDLGFAIDPRTGQQRKIDILVSAKSVKKRKNFGQMLEALCNECSGDGVLVIPDEQEVTQENLEAALESVGLPKDGSMDMDTYAGKLRGVCGTVFWGVTKDVEDQLWDATDTIRRNGRELRVAGLKFSSVEFRALNTRFGKDNPIVDEILSYVQGTEDLHEQIRILRSKINDRDTVPYPRIDVDKVKPLVQTEGTMFTDEQVHGTVVDEFYQPDGFYMRLPLPYQTTTDQYNREVTEGIPQAYFVEEVQNIYNIDTIYVPSSNLRKCWRHDAGKFGLSDLGVLVNNVVKTSHALINAPDDPSAVRMYYMAIRMYFDRVAIRMGSKRGEISTYGMSVRYPFSAKAVATLSNELPKNTVEIHRSMAKRLHVNTGDVVIAERFPCLGFMSVRPQKVQITDDPLCRFTIRVSGNCLGSMSLDFDGDVLFLASFHTPEAKEALAKEWTNPNKSCYDTIKELNKKAGTPHTKSLVLKDYELKAFPKLTADTHATLVKRATGVKSHTGPVIALAYNIMRILENSDIKDNQKTNVAVEVFLDRVGNSVFKQKHGVKSLHEIVIDAICTGDVNMLVEEGFSRGTSTIICDVLRKKGAELGVENIKSYHEWAKANGRSKLINRIVRYQNRIYFASRALMGPCALLETIKSPGVDWPSKMFKLVLSGKSRPKDTELDKHLDSRRGIGTIKDENVKAACSAMWDYVRKMLGDAKENECVSFPPPDITPQEARKMLFEKLRRDHHGKRK
jgi:hypothetical protein